MSIFLSRKINIEGSTLKETVNINIADLEEIPIDSAQNNGWVKQIVKTKKLTISQLLVAQSTDLPYELNQKEFIYIVIDGHAKIKGSTHNHDLRKGALIYFPRGAHTQIKVLSPEVEFLVLEVLANTENGQSLCEHGTWVEMKEVDNCRPDRRVLVVQPEEPPAYEPANHSDTVNQCLFINDEVEVIRGKISAGGGASRHAHKGIEQITYLLEPKEENLLVYTPPGVPHAGENYEVPLDLIVIYSPPYRESLKYGKAL